LIKTLPEDYVLKDILISLNHLHIIASGSFEDDKINLTIHNFNTIPLNQIGHLY
jgi:hypothetical protein